MKLVTVNTPDGLFHMLLDEHDYVQVSGFGGVGALQRRLPKELSEYGIYTTEKHPYRQFVLEYYSGNASALDAIPRRQTGSEFQQKVWQAISQVPYGSTISYKQLATLSGRPAAVRAAGTICGRNKLILLIPCHRILKSDGGIGNYLYGAELKKSLLERERLWAGM